VIIGGTFPLWAWSILAMHALAAAWAMGRWPSYGDPDPKDLPFLDYGRFFIPAVAAPLLLLGPTSIGLARYVNQRVGVRKRRGVSVAIALGLGLFGITLLLADPAGIITWVVD
jgi:hypothetical protein